MKFLYCCILFIFIGLPKTSWSQKTYEKSVVQEDLRFLKDALYEGHPSAFRYYTKGKLDQFFDTIYHNLAELLTEQQAHLAFKKFASRVSCIHTTSRQTIPTDSVFPFQVRILNDKIYIRTSELKEIPAGSEMLQLDGNKREDIIDELRSFVPADGYITTFRDLVASGGFNAYYINYFQSKSPVEILLKLPDGREERKLIHLIKSKAGTSSPLKLSDNKYIVRTEHQGALLDTTSEKTVYVQFLKFDKKYKSFNKKLFDYTITQQVEHLILDLRNNTGGNINNAFDFLEYFITEPFGYQIERKQSDVGKYLTFKNKLLKSLAYLKYDLSLTLKHRKEAGLKIHEYHYKPKKKNHYNKKVYVLVNGYTASSASLVASYLKNRAVATIIGTETGGGEAGNNGKSFPTLVLPNTKFELLFPQYYLRYEINQEDKGRGVLPDEPIMLTIEQYLSGEDIAKMKVHELIRKATK